MRVSSTPPVSSTTVRKRANTESQASKASSYFPALWFLYNNSSAKWERISIMFFLQNVFVFPSPGVKKVLSYLRGRVAVCQEMPRPKQETLRMSMHHEMFNGFMNCNSLLYNWITPVFI